MLDWNNQNVIKRFEAARNAYKRYKKLADKSDYKRYVSFDMEKKRMNIVPVDSDNDAENYPIGKLLLDFVNLDLTDYRREWEYVRQLLDDPDAYLEYSYFNRGLGNISPKGNDAEFAKALCLDRLVKDYQHLHPYFLVYDSAYMTLQLYDCANRMDTELNLFCVQEEIKKDIDLYLNEQIDAPYAQLTATQRYLLHYRTAARMPFFTNQSTVYVRIPGESIIHKPFLSHAEVAYLEATIPGCYDVSASYPEIGVPEIKRAKRDDLIIEEGFSVQTARDMAMLELSRMVMLNMRVRRCEFCGKLFVPKGNHDTKFCKNIPAGHNKPCQVLGSNRAYAAKIRGKNADAEYRKVYKRLHQRKQKGAMTEQAFKEWQGNAQYLLQQCKDEKISLKEFVLNIENAYGNKQDLSV